MAILTKASKVMSMWAEDDSKMPARNGVKNIPISVEPEALQTAAGTLPRASAVKAMADCTVAGRVHKNRTPSTSSCGNKWFSMGWSSQPSSGKNKKVVAVTSKCRRQCLMPVQIAWRESLLPCRKKSKTMTPLVIFSKAFANGPEAGSKLARRTVLAKASVKLSGRKRAAMLMDSLRSQWDASSRHF